MNAWQDQPVRVHGWLTPRPGWRLHRVIDACAAHTAALRAATRAFAALARQQQLCEDTTEQQWADGRFEHRCYFYPARDCPGWQPGSRCGRIGGTVPADAGPPSPAG